MPDSYMHHVNINGNNFELRDKTVRNDLDTHTRGYALDNYTFTQMTGQYRQYNYDSIYTDASTNATVSSIFECTPGIIYRLTTVYPCTFVVWFFDSNNNQISYKAFGSGYSSMRNTIAYFVVPLNARYMAYEAYRSASYTSYIYDDTTISLTIDSSLFISEGLLDQSSIGIKDWHKTDYAYFPASGSGVISLSGSQSDDTYMSNLIPCKKGDKFSCSIPSTSASSYSWAVVDRWLNILEKASVNTDFFVPYTVTVTEDNAAFIVFCAQHLHSYATTAVNETKYHPYARRISVYDTQYVQNDIYAAPGSTYPDLNDDSYTITSGGFLNRDGHLVEDDRAYYTDYINLEKHPYILVRNSRSYLAAINFCIYDEEKYFIHYLKLGGNTAGFANGIIDTSVIRKMYPSAKYIRFSSYDAAMKVILSFSDKPITKIKLLNERNGYNRKNDDALFEDGSSTSILTTFVHCKEGDVFKYRGHGGLALYAAAFYDDCGSYTGRYVNASDRDNYTDITVPEGCYAVRFQSYRGSGRLVLSVISPYTDDEDTLTIKRANNLYKKMYYALGDSFTHGDWWHSSEYIFDSNTNGKDPRIFDYSREMFKTYPWQIMDRNEMSMESSNLAVNGQGITDIVAHEDYKKIPENCDYATIMIGLNDTTAHLPVGTIADSTSSTWYGCWNIILDWLTTNRIGVHIGVLIISAYLNADMRNATILICKKYGIPYLDFWNDPSIPNFYNKDGLDINVYNRVVQHWIVKTVAGETNWHPSLECHEFISHAVEQFLRKI